MAAPTAVEERKLATVLFADVVGFTSLSEETDHETVARMVDATFRALGDVVAEHGGTVDKYMGDSVMAVFGVPVAHDDDAERAVAAGLAMMALDGDLAFSIGINSGEVTVTSFAGAPDVTVIGDVVNVAARLEKVAGPGEVLCGRVTAQLAGNGVLFREREAALVKGKKEPVEVYEAVALRTASPAALAESVPLVGRDDELGFLQSQWRRVRRDKAPHFVLICGEAGSGKTRLLTELARSAEVSGTVVWASYPAYGAMGGARVAAEIASQLGSSADADVQARVRSLSGEIEPSLRAIDPSAVRQEQTWGFVKLIQEKCGDQPTLIVIDDAHRSGDRTLEMLVELSTRLAGVPLLIVLGGRSEPGGWLTRFPSATTIRLSSLGSADSAALVEQLMADMPLSPEMSQFLIDKAAGNPLYIRELAAMARATSCADVEPNGTGGSTGEAVHAAGGGLEAALRGTLPASLQALLAGRLDALGSERKLVLQHVAVLGEAATAEQVAALGSAAPIAALDSLVEEGLLRLSREGRYDIADPLLREVAYETLPRHARGSLHARAAGVKVRAEERARHLDQAADYLDGDAEVEAAAAAALAEAGTELLAASRYLDALSVLERALKRGCRTPTALLRLAELQNMASRHDAALETLALIEDDPDDATLALERDHARANTVVFTEPGSAAAELGSIAERWHELGNPVKEAWAYSNLGVSLFNLSRLRESGEQLERGLQLFVQLGDEGGIIATSSFLCLVKPADARVASWLENALSFADAIGDRSKQVGTLTTLSWHHFFKAFAGSEAEAAEVESATRRLYELTEDLGAGEIAIHGRGLLAMTKRLGGNFDEVAEHLAVLRRLVATLGHDAWFGWAVSFALTVALGAPGSAPPYPPDSSLDPVDAMARIVIDQELIFAGRHEEVIERYDASHRGVHPSETGPLVDMSSFVYALAYALDGRTEEALAMAERARIAAVALDARSAVLAASALIAGLSGDTTGLPPCPESAASLADLLVMRAYASAPDGDPAAAENLSRSASRLRMPGLALVPV